MAEFVAGAKLLAKQLLGEHLAQQRCTLALVLTSLKHTAFLHKMVPFKGGAPARAALVSQSVQAVFGGNNTIAGFEDTIRPLATAGADRDSNHEGSSNI